MRPWRPGVEAVGLHLDRMDEIGKLDCILAEVIILIMHFRHVTIPDLIGLGERRAVFVGRRVSRRAAQWLARAPLVPI
jgi:hypothetical protein